MIYIYTLKNLNHPLVVGCRMNPNMPIKHYIFIQLLMIDSFTFNRVVLCFYKHHQINEK